ncbi:MAG: hypothetical protein MI866_02550 [Bacteroidales bacterium]|nr:hypothetical protein [Bacteroidales bacterium]
MKNLAELGVQELNATEMKSINGGFINYIVGYLIGKAIDSAPKALEAATEIKREGGTLAADMPFK